MNGTDKLFNQRGKEGRGGRKPITIWTAQRVSLWHCHANGCIKSSIFQFGNFPRASFFFVFSSSSSFLILISSFLIFSSFVFIFIPHPIRYTQWLNLCSILYFVSVLTAFLFPFLLAFTEKMDEDKLIELIDKWITDLVPSDLPAQNYFAITLEIIKSGKRPPEANTLSEDLLGQILAKVREVLWVG